MSSSDTAALTPPAAAAQNAHRHSKPGELHILGAHDAILYHGDDVEVKLQDDPEDDDSFFDLSMNDVKKMYSELQTKRQTMEDTPLMTKSARDLEKDTHVLRKLHDYPNTIVRIRFSNRFVLQGTFRTSEKIESIYNWLQQLLANPHLNFYLFTAPPKKILDRGTLMVEEGVVGMAVIYFGSDDQSAPPDQKILKPDFYNKLSAPDAVNEFVHKKLKKSENSSAVASNGPVSNSNNMDASSASTSRRPVQTNPPKKPTGAVPKWFRTN